MMFLEFQGDDKSEKKMWGVFCYSPVFDEATGQCTNTKQDVPLLHEFSKNRQVQERKRN